MIARGLGIETLCLYLMVAPAALFDVIVALGLQNPHDRPHRRAGGRSPWLADDVAVFIALWMEGWAAASLAERFGRPRNGIWSKARQLGLPRRERKAQFRPADPRAVLGRPLSAWPTTRQVSDAVLPTVPVAAPSEPAVAARKIPHLDIPGVSQAQLEACLDLPAMVRKGKRGEIAHDAARDLQLGLRVFSSQHYLTSAREMGMSVSAFTSRRRRLGIPKMARGECVQEFNVEWAATMIRALGYKRVHCRGYMSQGVDFFFWTKASEGIHRSELAKSKAWHKDAFGGLGHLY